MALGAACVAAFFIALGAARVIAFFMALGAAPVAALSFFFFFFMALGAAGVVLFFMVFDKNLEGHVLFQLGGFPQRSHLGRVDVLCLCNPACICAYRVGGGMKE